MFLVSGTYWFYIEASKPLIGTKIEELGRDHVEVGTEVTYNSNPPTSGFHYVEPSKPGVYTTQLDDRNLVHSLEHGYVIISFNCEIEEIGSNWSLVEKASAHDIEYHNEGFSAATPSATLSPEFSSQSCQDLITKLTDLANEYDQWKVIVVPRVNMEHRLALTAWTYLLEMDKFDGGLIREFVETHRDHGPEKTME